MEREIVFVMNKAGYKLHIDFIRIIAVLLVITNHVDINYYFYHDTTSNVTFLVSLFVTIMCLIDVPLFFMISGALLLPREESLTYIWKKRIFKIFAVLFIFSLLQYIILALRGKIDNYGLVDFIKRFCSGNIQEPYWFLYYYLGFLVMLPVLSSMARNLKNEVFKLLFGTRLMLDFVVPFISYTFGIELNVHITEPLTIIGSNIIFFLAGYYIENRIEVDKKNVVISLVVAIIILIASMTYIFFNYIEYGTINDGFVNRLTFVLTILCYYVFKYFFQNVDSAFVRKIAGCVFGVYLIESMVRMIYLGLYKQVINSAPGVVGAFLYIVLTAITSFIVVYVYRSVVVRIRKMF